MHTHVTQQSSMVLCLLALLVIGGLIGTGFAHMPHCDDKSNKTIA